MMKFKCRQKSALLILIEKLSLLINTEVSMKKSALFLVFDFIQPPEIQNQKKNIKLLKKKKKNIKLI